MSENYENITPELEGEQEVIEAQSEAPVATEEITQDTVIEQQDELENIDAPTDEQEVEIELEQIDTPDEEQPLTKGQKAKFCL